MTPSTVDTIVERLHTITSAADWTVELLAPEGVIHMCVRDSVNQVVLVHHASTGLATRFTDDVSALANGFIERTGDQVELYSDDHPYNTKSLWTPATDPGTKPVARISSGSNGIGIDPGPGLTLAESVRAYLGQHSIDRRDWETVNITTVDSEMWIRALAPTGWIGHHAATDEWITVATTEARLHQIHTRHIVALSPTPCGAHNTDSIHTVLDTIPRDTYT